MNMNTDTANDNRNFSQFRKAHYELLASALKRSKDVISNDTDITEKKRLDYLRGYAVAEYYILQMLLHDNPNFKCSKFINAINNK